jgi:hypothetical protein
MCGALIGSRRVEAMALRCGRLTRCAGLVETLLIVAGCGHGGGGGPTHPSTVGTYLGTAEVTVAASNVSTTGRGLGIQFVVSRDRVVSVGQPGQPPVGSAPLNGNSFVINAAGSVVNSQGSVAWAPSFFRDAFRA